jgi:protein tyrosine/serine phosphatase
MFSTYLLLSVVLTSCSATADPSRETTPDTERGRETRAELLKAKPAPSTTAPRPDTWAKPLTVAGLPNLHKVSDNLYRCAQPSAEGFRNLGPLGIKTVVSLRAFHSDRTLLGDTAVAYERIDMKSWHPEEEDVVRFLRIVNDPKRVPVLVHCQHGADRTGTMCAMYRIAVQGWSKDDALREMTGGGFGFHEVWQNLLHYINAVDIERVKKKAGIDRAS